MNTEDIRRAVAGCAPDFAAWLFPNGKRIGARWHVGDVSGTPGGSLAIELEGQFAGGFCDWATGERGDCIALVMAARGLDFVSAKRLLAERYAVRAASAATGPKPHCEKPLRPDLPSLECGTRTDIDALSRGRNLAAVALETASERGNLWFYNSREGRAWLITDRVRRIAQARRLDGKPWEWNGKKAWTLRGSRAGWPVGLPESATCPAIALCEGAPDFLAAFHHAHASGLAECIAPVCLVGASVSILAECLPAFAGKRVRVFVHDDPEGLAAALRWAGQLRDYAAHVAGFAFDGLTRTDGARVKDLCDLASISVDSWEEHRQIVEGCMSFATEGRAA